MDSAQTLGTYQVPMLQTQYTQECLCKIVENYLRNNITAFFQVTKMIWSEEQSPCFSALGLRKSGRA